MKLDPDSRRLLTKETKDGDGPVTAVTCDIDGKRLGPGDQPIPVYTDLVTGKAFARIVAVIPSNPDPASQAARQALLALNPVHYDGNDGAIRGWYVAAPDFSYHPAPQQ